MDWTAFWNNYLPPQTNQPWTPTYLPQQYVSQPDNRGGLSVQPLNVTYFPDAASCEHLRHKYCPLSTLQYVDLVTGPVSASARVPYIVWPNGVAIMAGALAALWSNNPGNPDVADSLCLAAIKARGAA